MSFIRVSHTPAEFRVTPDKVDPAPVWTGSVSVGKRVCEGVMVRAITPLSGPPPVTDIRQVGQVVPGVVV